MLADGSDISGQGKTGWWKIAIESAESS